eukprot:11728478-Ditylum_brightwellii.AAC.1
MQMVQPQQSPHHMCPYAQYHQLFGNLTNLPQHQQFGYQHPGYQFPGPPFIPKQPTNQMYCWTHGSCNHGGVDCKHKANGHKEQATFAIRWA